MTPIIQSIGQQIEVGYDLATDRVLLVVAATRWMVWLTDADSERVAGYLTQAATELRRRRGLPP